MPISKKLPDALIDQPLVRVDSTLVNEAPEGVSLEAPEGTSKEGEEETVESLKRQLLSVKQSMSNLKGEYNKLKARLESERSVYSDVSRMFRIYLSILQGMAARGIFDSDKLRTNPGSEKLLMDHAVGLTQLANERAKGKF